MKTSVKLSGNFIFTRRYLRRLSNKDPVEILTRYGNKGVAALYEFTPKRTGLTASSWRFEINKIANGYNMAFINDNIQNGVNVALIIQEGHATSGGGYVSGIDYINPALAPIFEQLANEAFEEVAKL